MQPVLYRRAGIWSLCAAFVVGLTVAARAAEEHAGHGSLGKVDFPISCSPESQASFTRAITLLHHMTYPQARDAFRELIKDDPGCAMGYWGFAMTLFQPLWPTRPSPVALEQGWEAVEKAKEIGPPTERERMFVAAAEAFFQDPKSNDYWARIRRWEAAMSRAFAAFPDDPEVGAFYALAHLATAPATTISREHSDRAAEILLRIYRQNPDHPGAMHYLVHANDVPGRERESLEITRKYEQVAPNNPHALHMPTHIYTRLGEWDGVVRGNLKAATAALAHPAGDQKEYVWDEFAHAIEYLVYAYLQQGADDAAAAQLERLQQTEHLEPSFKTAFHISSTRARYALERRDWKAAAAIVPRQPADVAWDRFPWPEAISWFTHGLGSVHLGNVDEAKTAVQHLETLAAAMEKAGEELFTRNIRVLRLDLMAWIAHAEKRDDASLALMREAAALEEATPKHAVTPGPTLPAHELLGDLLLEQKQPAEAFVAYKRALQLYPRRLNGLLGAARSAKANGDTASARKSYQELIALAGSGQRRQPIKEAEAFLATGQ